MLFCSIAGASSLNLVLGGPVMSDYGLGVGANLELDTTPRFGLELGAGLGAINAGGRFYFDSELSGVFAGARVSTLLIKAPDDQGNVTFTGFAGRRWALNSQVHIELEGALGLSLFQYATCGDTGRYDLFCASGNTRINSGSFVLPSVKMRLGFSF